MVQFTTCVGRIVWGHPLKQTPKKGDDGKPIIGQDGKTVMTTAFGVAFPKADFQATIYPYIMQVVQSVFPQGAPGHFAWKFVDGDASSGHRSGKPYYQREGYPGCYVMKFETFFPIQVFMANERGAWDQIGENQIKTGDYVAVSVNMEAHKGKEGRANANPGLYTNPQGVLLIGVGQQITSAPDAATMFGGQQFAMPAGAQAPGSIPQMPANAPGMQFGAPGGGVMQQPQQPMMQQPMMQQPMMQQPMMQQPMMQQPTVPAYQPAPDFVQNAMGQAPQQPSAPGQMPMGGIPGFPGQR